MAAEGAVATPMWTGKPLAEAAETMAAVSAAGMAPLLTGAAEAMAAVSAAGTRPRLAEAAEAMAAASAAGMAQLLAGAAEAMAAGVGQQLPVGGEVPPKVVVVAIRPLAVAEAAAAVVQRGLAAEALRLEVVVEAVQQQAGAAGMVSAEAMQPEARAAEPAAAGALWPAWAAAAVESEGKGRTAALSVRLVGLVVSGGWGGCCTRSVQ